MTSDGFATTEIRIRIDQGSGETTSERSFQSQDSGIPSDLDSYESDSDDDDSVQQSHFGCAIVNGCVVRMHDRCCLCAKPLWPAYANFLHLGTELTEIVLPKNNQHFLYIYSNIPVSYVESWDDSEMDLFIEPLAFAHIRLIEKRVHVMSVEEIRIQLSNVVVGWLTDLDLYFWPIIAHGLKNDYMGTSNVFKNAMKRCVVLRIVTMRLLAFSQEFTHQVSAARLIGSGCLDVAKALVMSDIVEMTYIPYNENNQWNSVDSSRNPFFMLTNYAYRSS